MSARMTAATLSKGKIETELIKAKKEIELARRTLEHCSEVEAKVGEKEKVLSQDLKRYVNSKNVQQNHFNWTTCAPALSEVENVGLKLIDKRLHNVLLEWAATEDVPLKQALDSITDMCRHMQTEFDLNITNLNSLELGFSLLNSSCQIGNLSNKETVTSVIEHRLWEIAERVFSVIGTWSAYYWVRERVARARNKRSIEQMNQITEQAIAAFSLENHLDKLITDSFTGRYRKWLIDFKKVSESIIEATNETIQEMEQDLKLNKDTLEMFMPLEKKLNDLLRAI